MSTTRCAVISDGSIAERKAFGPMPPYTTCEEAGTFVVQVIVTVERVTLLVARLLI